MKDGRAIVVQSGQIFLNKFEEGSYRTFLGKSNLGQQTGFSVRLSINILQRILGVKNCRVVSKVGNPGNPVLAQMNGRKI